MTGSTFKTGSRVLFTRLCRRISLLLFAFLALRSEPTNAQIVVTSPVNNQVFQRNSAGIATIPLTSYIYTPYTRIEVDLIPIEGNTHIPKQWVFEASETERGFLTAALKAETGWYRLTLRGFTTYGIVDTTIVNRIGIGEVFLVAGNSNAMGLPGLGAKNASDQVVSYNAVNKILNRDNITVAPNEPPGLPQFSPLSNENFIFPTGETSWYWGELGDMINKRLNTPVLFLNAAWAAANSENYRDAASGKDAFNLYVGKHWPNRQPYSNIVNTIRYFNSMLGMRAVLWSHGENDAQLGFKEEDYFNNIRTLIANSRKDSGYNIPWMIAGNSASNTIKDPYLPVTRAQKRLAEIDNFNTFHGPDLDTIQIPRPSSGHFENVTGGIQGLTQAASAWNRSLSDSLFRQITPSVPAYAIHTGIVPSTVFPGCSFILPYEITGKASDTIAVHAELLDHEGKFAGYAGQGRENLMQIKLPNDLKNGQYRIRTTGSAPIVAGSVSAPFFVDNTFRKIEYVHSISARPVDGNIQISWVVAVNPKLSRMVLQKTTDGENYSDVAHFDAIDNAKHSRVYGFQDPDTGENSIFYRLQIHYTTGEAVFSPVVAVFQKDAPPDFLVFPNPVTRQQFYMRTESQDDFRCSLYDLRGKEHPIQISDREVIGLFVLRPALPLPAGNYLLRIEKDSGITTQMILFE
jgi:hypothetical protein